MEDKLKRNLWKTGIFMLITAAIPASFFLMMCVPDISTAWPLAFMLLIFYGLYGLFVLVWGSTQVIWELPFRKVWRTIVFLLWLILYPALWLGWYYLCCVCFFKIFHVH
jgi:hypothetical protein